MSGRMKKVHFSPSELLKYKRVRIPFGQENLLIRSIEATPIELDTLFHIIRELSNIDIKLTPSNEHTIKQFIEQIKQLLELNCMLAHKEYIKTSTRNVFVELIDQMPAHTIQPGCPGYQYHVDELKQIDKTIKMINLGLNKINVINTCSSTLSLQSPSQLNDFGFHGLPHNLPAFVRSIDVSIPGHLYEWGSHFRNHSIQTLGTYLAQVTTSIQQLTDNYEVDAIISKLKQFIKKLKKSGYTMQLEMFSDVASDGNRSPLRSPQKKHENTLKYQLDELLDPDVTSFNHDFHAFRQELSKAKDTAYIQLNMLLHALHTYLLEKNISDTSPQTKILQHYLGQCLNRIEHPLPEHLQSTLDDLLLNYDDAHNNPFSRRTRYKYDFLTTLVGNITIHPEKTYAECYRLTEASSEVTIQAFVAEKQWTLFGKHRFKNFIRELLLEEPDYDVNLNNLSHNDAGCFSC
jgi:hypothetical protein